MGISNAERETIIRFGYDEKTIDIFTTEQGVVSALDRRLGNTEYAPEWKGSDRNFSTTISMECARHPSAIVRLLNEEARTRMTDEQKAALREAQSTSRAIPANERREVEEITRGEFLSRMKEVPDTVEVEKVEEAKISIQVRNIPVENPDAPSEDVKGQSIEEQTSLW